MGGAPPPLPGFAPQGAKKGHFWPFFGWSGGPPTDHRGWSQTARTPEDHKPGRGVGRHPLPILPRSVHDSETADALGASDVVALETEEE